MGAVCVDLWRLERQYEINYPLDNPFGVRAVLEDYGKLWQRVINEGDYDALNVILDFIDALTEAKLTSKQKAALYYVFVEKMTQEEAAGTLGYADHKGVGNLIGRALLRIAESQGYDEEVFREKHGH